MGFFQNSICKEFTDIIGQEMNEIDPNSSKIKLYDKCNKQNFVNSKDLISLVKTETTQLLTKSLINDDGGIKGFVHESSIYPYGFLLQSNMQVSKLIT